MSRLYEITDIGEATPVQYVGVYVLHWPQHPEQPEVGFHKSKYSTEDIEGLVGECRGFLENLNGIFEWDDGWAIEVALEFDLKSLRAALARFKDDDDE